MKIIIALFLLFSVLITSQADYNEQQAQYERYCESVQIFKDSNGEFGHPNYNDWEC